MISIECQVEAYDEANAVFQVEDFIKQTPKLKYDWAATAESIDDEFEDEKNI